MATRIRRHHKGRYFIKAHWERSGLSRETLAGRLEVTPEHVSRMVKNADEFHKIENRRLFQLAEIFGVSVDELKAPPLPKGEAKRPSIDARIKDEPDEVKDAIDRLVDIYLAGRRRA